MKSVVPRRWLPHDDWIPEERIWSPARASCEIPRLPSRWLAAAGRDSPVLTRLPSFWSSRITRPPARATVIAVADPAGPPPITTTSNSVLEARPTLFPDVPNNIVFVARSVRPNGWRRLHQHKFRKVRITGSGLPLDDSELGEISNHLIDLIHVRPFQAPIPCRPGGEGEHAVCQRQAVVHNRVVVPVREHVVRHAGRPECRQVRVVFRLIAGATTGR